MAVQDRGDKPLRVGADAPVDPRLVEFVEALAGALAADHLRALAEKQQPPPPKATPA
jgi:hypothetical protein